jgi:hypothetical protein
MLKNVAAQVIEFAPRDSSGLLAPGCGATLSLYVAKDGGALTAAAGVLSEKQIGDPATDTGLLKYVPTQAETNCDALTLFWQDTGDAIDDYLSLETNPGWTATRAGYLDVPVSSVGLGAGANAITITVDDGTDPLAGATVAIRASAGGANVYRVVTDTLGEVTVNLDDGTYYVQCSLVGYRHVEESLAVSTNPQSATVSMTGISVPAPDNPDLVRLYLVQRTADGEFLDGNPFTLRLNTDCLDAAGEVVPRSITGTDDAVNGYVYADVYPTASLTRVDGGSAAITYLVRTALGATTEIEVEASPSVQDLSGLLHP